MKYSVVIPVFNAQDTIGFCLDALVAQELLPDEIIIVDNNSTDKTVQVVQDFKEKNKKLSIILAKEEKRCPAAARNKGIELATGNIIVFTDSDCIPRRDWIKNINYVFVHEDPDAVGGVVDLWWDKGIAQRYQATYWVAESALLKRTWLISKERLFNNEFVMTSNLAFKRNALIELGGFNTSFSFPAGEDTDLWMRALDKDYKTICWDPTIVICHKKKEALSKIVKQTIQYETSNMRILKMHLKDKIIIHIPFKGFIFAKSPGWPMFMGRHSMEFLILLAIAFFNFRLFIFLFIAIFLFYTYRVHIKFKRLEITTNIVNDLGGSLILLTIGLIRIISRLYSCFRYGLICI